MGTGVKVTIFSMDFGAGTVAYKSENVYLAKMKKKTAKEMGPIVIDLIAEFFYIKCLKYANVPAHSSSPVLDLV